MTPKRVLITDGSGFIAANLAREMLKQGHSVELLLRHGYSDWRISKIKSDVGLNVGNLSDPARLRQIIQSTKPDWIFHLSACGADLSRNDLQAMAEAESIGTSNLLQAAREWGFEAFIDSGSSSNMAAPLMCGFTESLPVCTLRLYSVFGPFEDPTRLMPTLALRGLQGTLPLLGDPSVCRDFLYVDDVVAAYIAAANNASRFPGQHFDVGSGIQTTVREAVALARKEFRIGEEPIWGSRPDRSPDTLVSVADNRKIIRDLAWTPKTSVAQGLAKLGRWLKFDPDRFEYYADRMH